MDLLKKELERKRKILLEAKQVAVNDREGVISKENNLSVRYLKASHLRKLQEQREEEEQEAQRKRKLEIGITDNGISFNEFGNENVSGHDDEKKSTNSTIITPKTTQTESFPFDSKKVQQDHLVLGNYDGESSIIESKKRIKDYEETDSQVLLTVENGDNQTTIKSSAKKVKFDKNVHMDSIPMMNVTNSSIKDFTNRADFKPDDVTRKLRHLGLPIRLFGEATVTTPDGTCIDDSARTQRLLKALSEQEENLEHLSEKDEYRLGRGHGIRNPFLEKDVESTAAGLASYHEPFVATKSGNNQGNPTPSSSATEPDRSTGQVEDENEDNEDIKNDPHKRVYRYFKGLLKDWEADLLNRPDEVKRSVAGKNETKRVKQCKDYIRPLFKLCKNRTIEEGMLNQLVKMVQFCEQGEFVRAHDAYMDVAIGRAAWPIGVTMVGIHARTGRAKIESQNVAHVMNSELQRKYLTSVKRLLTYIQKKRTDVDPSKKVQN